MKILHVVCDGAPGGGTNHVMQLLGGLGETIECELLTEKGSYLFNTASDLGMKVHGGSFFKSRLDRNATARIREVVEAVQPDLVHCHGGRAAFFESFLPRKVPVVYTVHGFHHARKKIAQRTMGWLAEYRTIRRMSHVIFVSQYDRDLAVHERLLPIDKSHSVIHNGIAPPKRPTAGEPMGIGFVGRFVYQKNPELFLDVAERMPEEKFAMVGGGDLDVKIQSEIKRRNLGNRVSLLGSLDHKKTIEVISNLRMLVMTPRWEGLPLLPLEAMLLKVPIVSTAVGGIPEVLKHGHTGMLASTGSAEELAKHIQTLQRDCGLRNQIINNAFQFATSNFLEGRMLRRTSEVYASFLRTSKLRLLTAVEKCGALAAGKCGAGVKLTSSWPWIVFRLFALRP